ncbi:MAG TPA: hypothetical protein VIF62_21510 [Labilithrix sp.]
MRLSFASVVLLALAACSPKPRIEWLPDTRTPPSLGSGGQSSQMATGGLIDERLAATRDGDSFVAEQSAMYGPVTVYRIRGGAREPIVREETVTDASIVIGTRHVWIMLTSSLESASDGRIYAAPREGGAAHLVTTSALFSGLGVVDDDAVFVTNAFSILGREHGYAWATRDEQSFELRRVSASSREQVLWKFDAACGAVYASRDRDVLLFVQRKSTQAYARITLP